MASKPPAVKKCAPHKAHLDNVVANLQLVVGAISAVISVIAGFLYAHYVGYVDPTQYGFAMVVQIIGGIFAPGVFSGGTFELLIAGFGTVLFVGAAFVDFYTMPRTYSDDQYLAGALGMYLTYINLFIFILRLIIALQGGGRRD